MTDAICIYHGDGCLDGFGAAWVVHRAFKRLGRPIDFHAAAYGDAPPDVTGREVIIVDFSYRRPVLDEMTKVAHSILILDHHKSAKEDLAELWHAPDFDTWRAAAWDLPLSESARTVALFDMDRSGAGMAWDYFFPREQRPDLIDLIEDRDLWRFRLRGTRQINDCLFSHALDFAVWDELVSKGQSPAGRQQLFGEGEAIGRKFDRDLALILGMSTRSMVIGGIEVQVANVPRPMASDAANELAKGRPFGAAYFDRSDKRQFSLRSGPDGVDVAELAQRYGGGGHKRAAGFEVPLGWEGDTQ